MGIFCAGAVFASPPTETSHEIVTVITDTSPTDQGYTLGARADVVLNFEAVTAPDSLDAGHYPAALAVDNRVDIVVPVSTIWVYRWRDNYDGYAYDPVNMTYRPGWKRKVCEG